MITFEKIKNYYEKKYWTKDMVKNAVKMNKITGKEYEVITGENYN